MAQQARKVPGGYTKTSFEISREAKFKLEGLKSQLRRDGFSGASEAAIIETLILTARKTVDEDVLAKVIKTRLKAQGASK